MWRAVARARLSRNDDTPPQGQADLLVLAGDIDGALRARPDDPCALAWRAKRHLEAGRAPEALADLDRAARQGPDGVEAIFALRARAALAMGSAAVAEEAGAEAVRLGPDYGPAHAALAAAQWSRGQAVAARASLDRALKLDAADADAHELDGTMRLAEGAKPAAVAAWERAVLLDPSRQARLEPMIEKIRE
jgi:tetratricopeptide (TPR) repeat protein